MPVELAGATLTSSRRSGQDVTPRAAVKEYVPAVLGKDPLSSFLCERWTSISGQRQYFWVFGKQARVNNVLLSCELRKYVTTAVVRLHSACQVAIGQMLRDGHEMTVIQHYVAYEVRVHTLVNSPSPLAHPILNLLQSLSSPRYKTRCAAPNPLPGLPRRLRCPND